MKFLMVLVLLFCELKSKEKANTIMKNLVKILLVTASAMALAMILVKHRNTAPEDYMRRINSRKS
jgi:hypothetical protein